MTDDTQKKIAALEKQVATLAEQIKFIAEFISPYGLENPGLTFDEFPLHSRIGLVEQELLLIRQGPETN